MIVQVRDARQRFGTADMDELCQYLRSERLRLGLSLQDVARKAKISISLLKALEQGRFQEIGPPPLVHAHLLACSRALGVNQTPFNPRTGPPPGTSHISLTRPARATRQSSRCQEDRCSETGGVVDHRPRGAGGLLSHRPGLQPRSRQLQQSSFRYGGFPGIPCTI